MDFRITQVQSSDRDWVISAHMDHYTRFERFDARFAKAVSQAFDDCHLTPGGGGWIAWAGGLRHGSLLLGPSDPDALRLRLLLVTGDARGRGLGRRLLTVARETAQARGKHALRVSTFAEHTAACGLYQSFGFGLDSTEPTQAFGRDLTLQSWSYPLAIAESER